MTVRKTKSTTTRRMSSSSLATEKTKGRLFDFHLSVLLRLSDSIRGTWCGWQKEREREMGMKKTRTGLHRYCTEKEAHIE